MWTWRDILSSELNGTLGGGYGVAAEGSAIGMGVGMHLAGAAVPAIHVECRGALLEVADVVG